MMTDSMLKLQEEFKNDTAVLFLSHSVTPTIDSVPKLKEYALENGKIYVNYEAKNGRIFGMNRTNLCYKLKNEKVQYAKKK